MTTRLFNSIEVWLALGLLALSLAFAVECYTPPNTVTEFVTGLMMGPSIAANVYAIWQLPSADWNAHKRKQ